MQKCHNSEGIKPKVESWSRGNENLWPTQTLDDNYPIFDCSGENVTASMGKLIWLKAFIFESI